MISGCQLPHMELLLRARTARRAHGAWLHPPPSAAKPSLCFTEEENGAGTGRPSLLLGKFPACLLDKVTLAGFRQHLLISKPGLEQAPASQHPTED